MLKPKQRDMVTEENENIIQTGTESNPAPAPNVEPQEKQESPASPPPAPPDEKKMRSALAGDEGFYANDIQLEDIKPGDNDSPEPAPDNKPPVESVPQKTETPPAPTQQEIRSKWLWEQLKGDYEKQFGEGTFKAPEGITPENEYEVMLDFFQKNLEPDLSGYPDEIREQIELHRQGQYDPSKYFENRSTKNDITKLGDQDFLFEIYKAKNGKSEQNPDGFSDEDIQEFLSRKSRIELHEMAQAGRTQIKELQKQSNEARIKQAEEIKTQQFEKLQKDQIAAAEKIVNQFKGSRDYFGIEFTPEDKAQFDKDFVEMVKINKETGVHKLAEMLSDDTTLYKVAAFLWKGENLRGYITQIKEGIKTEIEKKLDPALEKEKGSTKLAKPVDRGKLV